jgi:hypothetical protein
MFLTDDAPIRVTASTELASLLSQARAVDPEVVVVLDDLGARLSTPPADGAVIYLGELDPGTPCYATADSHTPWWRFRADLDCNTEGIDFNLTEMDDTDLAATIAAGPLPRGLRLPTQG